MSALDIGIEFEQRDKALVVTLNRPKALNSLTLEMCLQMEAALDAAAEDDAVGLVIVRGAGDRAFCAGGDVRRVVLEGKAGGDYPYRFFKNEYRLNAKIAAYPKPYIAMMDGIVMGGGVGLSVHGSHRVVSEKINFAMPETGIGLFPDVGGGYFLSRLPGQVGLYLALTGERIGAADVMALGVGDALVPADKMAALADALSTATDIDATIKKFAVAPGAPSLDAHRAVIDKCFGADSVEGIVAALQADGGEWAAHTAKDLLSKSPTSLKVSFRQVREAAAKTFNEDIVTEYRIACGCVAGHDFYEGVRAALIDKDHAPKWRPADLAGVTDADVAGYFDKTPPDGDLDGLPANSK